MKKLLLVAGILLSTLGSNAQNKGDISLDLYGGYTFQDKIYTDVATLTVKDGFQYGVGLEFFLRNTKSLELKYLRMDTKTPVHGIMGAQWNPGNDSSATNMIMLAGNNYFETGNPKILPFIGFGMGAGWMSGDLTTSARFAWDLKAGVKIKASDAVSVKLHAYFQTIWGSYGSDVYYYPGWGYVSYPEDASLYQFGLGAALAFDFKH